MIEIDPKIIIGKDKTMGKIGTEMIIEGMGICKILIEMAAILTGAIVMIGVDQEKEVHPPGGMIIITGKNGSPRFRSRSRSRSSSRITTKGTGLDVIDVKSMTTLQMNVQIL